MAKDDKRANSDYNIDPRVATVEASDNPQKVLEYSAGISFDQSLNNMGEIVKTGEDSMIRSANFDRAVEENNFLFNIQKEDQDINAQLKIDDIKAKIDEDNFSKSSNIELSRRLEAKEMELTANNEQNKTQKLMEYAQDLKEDIVSKAPGGVLLSGRLTQDSGEIIENYRTVSAKKEFEDSIKYSAQLTSQELDNSLNNIRNGVTTVEEELPRVLSRVVDTPGFTPAMVVAGIGEYYGEAVENEMNGYLSVGDTTSALACVNKAGHMVVEYNGTKYPVQITEAKKRDLLGKITTESTRIAKENDITEGDFTDEVSFSQRVVDSSGGDLKTTIAQSEELEAKANKCLDGKKRAKLLAEAGDFKIKNVNSHYAASFISQETPDKIQNLLDNVQGRLDRYAAMTNQKDIMSDLIHKPNVTIPNSAAVFLLRAPNSLSDPNGQANGHKDLMDLRDMLKDGIDHPEKYKTIENIGKFNSDFRNATDGITKIFGGDMSKLTPQQIQQATKFIGTMAYFQSKPSFQQLGVLPKAAIDSLNNQLNLAKKSPTGYSTYKKITSNMSSILGNFNIGTNNAIAKELKKDGNQAVRGALMWSTSDANSKKYFDYISLDVSSMGNGAKNSEEYVTRNGYKESDFQGKSKNIDNVLKQIGVTNPNDVAFYKGTIRQTVMGSFVTDADNDTKDVTDKVIKELKEGFHMIDGHAISKAQVTNPQDAKNLAGTAAMLEKLLGEPINTSLWISRKGVPSSTPAQYDTYRAVIDSKGIATTTMKFVADANGVILVANNNAGQQVPVSTRMGTKIFISYADIKQKPSFCDDKSWMATLVMEQNAIMQLERTIGELEKKPNLSKDEQYRLDFAQDVHDKMMSPEYRTNRTRYFDTELKHEIQVMGKGFNGSDTLTFIKSQQNSMRRLEGNIHKDVYNSNGSNGTPEKDMIQRAGDKAYKAIPTSVKEGAKTVVNTGKHIYKHVVDGIGAKPAAAAEFSPAELAKMKGTDSKKYETKLPPAKEVEFKKWESGLRAKGIIHQQDQGQDYDFRGAFAAGVQPDKPGEHWPDTFKKPNHETFSIHSKYAVGENAKHAGSWQGEGPNAKYIPPKERHPNNGRPTAEDYYNGNFWHGSNNESVELFKQSMYSSPVGKFYQMANATVSSSKTIKLDPIVRKQGKDMTKSDLWDIVVGACKEYPNIDPLLVWAVIGQESGGQTAVVSKKGAMGVMQLMPGTAAGLGVTNPYDPNQNIRAGVLYLSRNFKTYKGDLALTLASYNAGPGAVSKYKGVPPYKETLNYIKNIQAKYKKLKSINNFTV